MTSALDRLSALFTIVECVVVDADDTLWRDSCYFEALRAIVRGLVAQDGVSPAAWECALVEASILTRHGEIGFVETVREAMQRVGVGARSMSAYEQAAHEFLTHPIELFDGVEQTLARVLPRMRILWSKGVPNEQLRKLRLSGTEKCFDSIHVVERKDQLSCARLLEDIRVPPSRVVVIGNSIQHDVTPAVACGTGAIWMNHEGNEWGRNGSLPVGVIEVRSWRELEAALIATNR